VKQSSQTGTEHHEPQARLAWVALGLGLGFASLACAGLVLWWMRGEAVLLDLVSAAIAWCF
jgi:hypothetical protein